MLILSAHYRSRNKIFTYNTRGDRMAFGNFVDMEGQFIDSVHFPPVLRQFPFRGRGVYKITGTVCEEFDCISVEADGLEKMGLGADARYLEGMV